MGWIPTPLYDTLGSFQRLFLCFLSGVCDLWCLVGPEAVAFVVSQAEIPVIICSGDKIEKVRVSRYC
jgi:hypothetical protein